ncbi:MAG: NUDIX hydrolase [Litoreibacter sp.]|nr:NUDIX hydrolase [Litoreibacter sp.]
MSDTPIRDAASVVVLRDAATAPKILMGQRGKSAAFMPNKFVFPGGAVDQQDRDVELASLPAEICRARLDLMSDETLSNAILAAAVREVWEETGLIMGAASPQAAHVEASVDWQGFFAGGHLPTAAGLRYFFRAITPPGRPRRFDARFFLADANHLIGDLDDFSKASDELSHLHWVPLNEARDLDLPFITEVVLAEVEALAGTDAPPSSVPFFKNDTAVSQFIRLA